MFFTLKKITNKHFQPSYPLSIPFFHNSLIINKLASRRKKT